MTPLAILSITIMVIGSFLVWKCRPLTAICVYLGFIILYPENWSFKFGGMPTLFVGKVLIFPLMLNLVFKAKRLSGFRPNVLDAGVVLLLLGQLTAGLTQGEDLWQVIAEQSHYIATETLSYFAVRLSIRSRRDLLFLVKALALTATPLACIAIYESLTGDYVYTKLYYFLSGGQGELFALATPAGMLRAGFYRAAASFGNAIGLGLFFAACLPLALCLRNDPSWKWWQMATVIILLSLGLLSTVSGGPLLSFAVSAMVLAYYPLRKSLPVAIPLALGIVVLWQLSAPAWGVAAPTDHLRNLAFNPKNADYRTGLIEEAFTGGMEDHWYFGYGTWGFGEKKPNPEFNWRHKDLVNIHIGQLVRFGLFGFVPYLAVSLMSFLKLGQAARVKRYSSDTWLIWCVFAFFVGWQVAFLTVGAVRQITCLLYLLTGLISNLPSIVRRKM
jgi:hypothetical protein